MIWAEPKTVAVDAATPSIASNARQQADAGTGWRSASETVLTPRTWTATPSLAVATIPSKVALMVSPSTKEPTTKPTPRTMAREVRKTRSLLASRLRRASRRIMPGSGPRPRRERLHAVEDRLGGRPVHAVHDVAVGEEQHPVGAARRRGLVGDHDDRLAELVGGVAHDVEQLGRGVRVELAGRLVGEDDVRARHQGARGGDALLLPAGELAGSVLEPVAEAEGVHDLVQPRPLGVAPGDVERKADVLQRGEGRDQVEGLEDEADALAADLVSCFSERPVSSTSPIQVCPEVRRSRPAMHCMSVDLPDPEGPMIAVNAPGANSTSMPSIARTWLSPCP